MKPPRAEVSTKIVMGAALLLAGCISLTWISPRFEYGSSLLDRPILLVVAVLTGMGAVYLALTLTLARSTLGTGALAASMVLGLAMRIVFFFSTPIQEDDFYRYLWDGAVVGTGYSPYRFSPEEVARDASDVPPRLRRSRDESGVAFSRINFPELTTVYPPVAQAAFATAHAIRPWSLTAWRAVILTCDAATLAFVLLILRSTQTPVARALIYWWNPLLLFEAYNSAHMDVVALPFAAGAVWFAVRRAPTRATLLLAVAAAAKFWPLLIAPFIARANTIAGRRTVVASVMGAALFTVLIAPMLLHAGRSHSGLTTYSRTWEMNDAFFVPVSWAAHALCDAVGADANAGDIAARAIVAVIVLACAAALSIRPVSGAIDFCNRAAIALGVMFMLSPTQFPWYYLWLVPFLAVRPRVSLLIWSVTLPLYYLKFHYAARGEADFFHTRIVWLEHAPVALAAAWEWFAWRRTPEASH